MPPFLSGQIWKYGPRLDSDNVSLLLYTQLLFLMEFFSQVRYYRREIDSDGFSHLSLDGLSMFHNTSSTFCKDSKQL